MQNQGQQTIIGMSRKVNYNDNVSFMIRMTLNVLKKGALV